MRILIFNWQDIKNPLGGGAEVHLHEIFKRIVAMGNDVTLVVSSFPGGQGEEIIEGIRVIRKGNRNTFNFMVPKLYKKLINNEQFDIVIDDINKIPFYTPLFVRKPLLAISHHFFGKSIFREVNFVKGLYVYLAEYLVNFIYKKTPFVVVSESTKNEFIERGFSSNNVVIVTNAITKENFPMKISEKNSNPLIIYFGRLKKYKSIDHLLYAFRNVLEIIPNTELFILGKGDFKSELESLAHKLNIDRQTKFFGYISEEQKIELLSKAYCIVNTSMKEGWGITNIEANACGTPVISADVPGLRDSVKEGESGLLYEYGNIEQLTSLILKILQNNEYRTKLSEGSIEWAKNFSWDSSAQLMFEVCNKIIKRKQENGN